MQNIGHIFLLFFLFLRENVVLLHIQPCMAHETRQVISASKCFITLAQCSQARCGQA